ncbi:primary-amine oxidase [Capronia epimyces CBS 606.96]|uniref:Amine oxidase n=1 Tax=Capronia epimyces CBS 606.96 TaxID=1182542 RepID=W9XWH7_9EURO|nr:primary-amine oxidase [Capronia epimyces CBS 606.96]EXJ84588.1 primary-amine oxidase [Capronia epimyces CBS 606.96]
MTATPSRHPFDPLTPQEISQAAHHVRAAFPNQDAYFRVITLSEPPKADMIQFLEAESKHDIPQTRLARVAMVQAFLGPRDSDHFFQLKVDVTSGKILKQAQLHGCHPHVDASDMQRIERACLDNSGVQDAIKAMQLPEGALVKIEPWTYATDGMNDMSQKINMCYFYMHLSHHPDANYYAYPLDLCVEVSGNARVLNIYSLPNGTSNEISTTARPYDQKKIHDSNVEYHPDLFLEHRTTTKPYHVSQPQGPSFVAEGNLIR